MSLSLFIGYSNLHFNNPLELDQDGLQEANLNLDIKSFTICYLNSTKQLVIIYKKLTLLL